MNTGLDEGIGIIRILIVGLWFALMNVPQGAFANHGPATSAGGSATLTGHTLEEGESKISVDTVYTSYEDVSAEETIRRAKEAGEFDALGASYLTNVIYSYGITDELELDGKIGWYSGINFRETHATTDEVEDKDLRDTQSNEVETATASPEGITDLSIGLKYRGWSGSLGDLSLLGGILLPTGENNQRLSNGDRLEPSSQPGTGAFGVQGGFSYSLRATSRIGLDVSGLYLKHTSNDGFEVGDRIDDGIAVSYKLSGSSDHAPELFSEVSHVWLGKDSSKGEGSNPNSGGTSYFLTTGVRGRLSERISVAIAPTVPLHQQLSGEQVGVDWRLYGQVTVLI